jgi:hypothetical protein
MSGLNIVSVAMTAAAVAAGVVALLQRRRAARAQRALAACRAWAEGLSRASTAEVRNTLQLLSSLLSLELRHADDDDKGIVGRLRARIDAIAAMHGLFLDPHRDEAPASEVASALAGTLGTAAGGGWAVAVEEATGLLTREGAIATALLVFELLHCRATFDRCATLSVVASGRDIAISLVQPCVSEQESTLHRKIAHDIVTQRGGRIAYKTLGSAGHWAAGFTLA